MKSTCKAIQHPTAKINTPQNKVQLSYVQNVCIFHMRRIWQCFIVHMGTRVLCVYGWVANLLLLHTE